jgi:anti-sigma-K factor RskA
MAAPGAAARRFPDMPDPKPSEPSDDVVPVFGSWRAIYAAVLASAVVVMALLALFSRWPF